MIAPTIDVVPADGDEVGEFTAVWTPEGWSVLRAPRYSWATQDMVAHLDRDPHDPTVLVVGDVRYEIGAEHRAHTVWLRRLDPARSGGDPR